MGELFATLEASWLAEWARNARWGYAVLNGTHILGIALLVGAMVPLNLLRLGLDVGLPQAEAARILVPSAMVGLVIAAGTGAVMFASRATQYAGLPVFQAKIALVAAGAALALALTLRHGPRMAGVAPAVLRRHAAVSLGLWVVVLYLGRMIAFAT